MAAQGELEREQNGRQVVQKMKARVAAGLLRLPRAVWLQIREGKARRQGLGS